MLRAKSSTPSDPIGHPCFARKYASCAALLPALDLQKVPTSAMLAMEGQGHLTTKIEDWMDRMDGMDGMDPILTFGSCESKILLQLALTACYILLLALALTQVSSA